RNKNRDKKMTYLQAIALLAGSWWAYKISKPKSKVEFGELELVGVDIPNTESETKSVLSMLLVPNGLRFAKGYNSYADWGYTLFDILINQIKSGDLLINQASYIMATAYHEMGQFSLLRERYNDKISVLKKTLKGDKLREFNEFLKIADTFGVSAEKAVYMEWKYGVQSWCYNPASRRKNLSNKYKGDGARFFGRGYCQWTGRHLYTKFKEFSGVDVLSNPDLIVNDKRLNALMTIKMMMADKPNNLTGVSLKLYCNENKTDYYNARRVVNSTDRAKDIASYAQKFENVFNSYLKK
ncbi:hypothetical protein, partial [Ornithobacterium rhinotracheale]